MVIRSGVFFSQYTYAICHDSSANELHIQFDRKGVCEMSLREKEGN